MSDNITFKQFKRLDIRIGTVVKVEVPKWSHWVIKLTVNLGSEIGERIIFAGVLGFYEPKDLEGKQMPFIVNLEPKKIGPKGDYSEGMMLMATPSHKATDGQAVEKNDEVTPPILIRPAKKVPNGTKVM